MLRLTLLLFLSPFAATAQSARILGADNLLHAEGSAALAAARHEEGIRLTLAGLERPNNPGEEAAAHSNLCAGYGALAAWGDRRKRPTTTLARSRSRR